MAFPPLALSSPEDFGSRGQELWGGGSLACCFQNCIFLKKREVERNLVSDK